MKDRRRGRKHVHKYERVMLGRNKDYPVWKCQLPGCPHYMPGAHLVVGQESICWRCGEIFVMTKDKLDLKKPHCVSCTKSRKPSVEETGVEILQPTQDEIEQRLNDLLKGL